MTDLDIIHRPPTVKNKYLFIFLTFFVGSVSDLYTEQARHPALIRVLSTPLVCWLSQKTYVVNKQQQLCLSLVLHARCQFMKNHSAMFVFLPSSLLSC